MKRMRRPRSSAAWSRLRCIRCTLSGRRPAARTRSTLLHDDPDADGTAGNDGTYFGVAPVVSPFKRLLNGGNEIEFYRCLAVGERCVVNARYADVQLKQGKSGAMLLVVVESEFTTEAGELLVINRQTLIWR